MTTITRLLRLRKTLKTLGLIWVGAWLLNGCAEVGPYIPAIVGVIENARDLVLDHTGGELEDFPTTCEHEYFPQKATLLLLCEVKLEQSKKR